EDQSRCPLGDAQQPQSRSVGITDATLPRLNQFRTDVQALRKHGLGYVHPLPKLVDLDARHRAWRLGEDRSAKIPLFSPVVGQRLAGGIQHILEETVLHCFLQPFIADPAGESGRLDERELHPPSSLATLLRSVLQCSISVKRETLRRASVG